MGAQPHYPPPAAVRFSLPLTLNPEPEEIRSLAKIMLVSKTISWPPNQKEQVQSRGIALLKNPCMDQASPAVMAGGNHHERFLEKARMGAFQIPKELQGRPFQLTLNAPPTPILPGGGDVVALSFAGSETPDPATGDGAFFTPAENMPDSQRVRSLAKIMLVRNWCPPSCSP